MKKCILILFFALLYSNSFAQVLAGSSFFDEIASDWHMGFTADASVAVSVPVSISSGGDGDMGVYQTAGIIKFQGAHKDRRFVNLDVGYEYSYFDFSNFESNLASADKTFARLFLQQKIDENWSVYTAVMGAFNASQSASLSDGLNFFGGAGIGYAFNEALSAGVGVAAYRRMDRDWMALPMGYINWTINKHLSLRSFSGMALIYDVFADGKLLLNFSFEYVSNYIRLSDAGSRKRSVRDSYYQVAAGGTYNITPGLYISASVAGNFDRELNYRTGGAKSGEVEIDAAPAFFGHIGYKF